MSLELGQELEAVEILLRLEDYENLKKLMTDENTSAGVRFCISKRFEDLNLYSDEVCTTLVQLLNKSKV